jgi:Bacterial Ig-like domain (group 3)/Beta-propeller repeat
MKPVYFVGISVCLTRFLLAQLVSVSPIDQVKTINSPMSKSQSRAISKDEILATYGKLPLTFEPNYGQTDERVKFVSHTSRYSLFLASDEAVFALKGNSNNASLYGASHILQTKNVPVKTGGILRMKLRNANPAAKVTGVDELAGTTNYFMGNDRKKWRTGVPTYAKVKYESIYSGIDLVYYGQQQRLEYDFIVEPHADPTQIAIEISGAKQVLQGARGELVFKVGDEEIRWHRPIVYQERQGKRQEVRARYAIKESNRIAFEIAHYDQTKPLYIDPLIYSTYLGGTYSDQGNGIAVDSAGSAYVIGTTDSINFPRVNSLQATSGGDYDAFVFKLNPAGSALLYSTYLGGSGADYGYGIAVDNTGNAYVIGYTQSLDFPTMKPLQGTNSGLGDAYVAKINSTGSALIYSTYLGGNGADFGYAIAVDAAGNAYVTGYTESADFHTIRAFQPTNRGGGDGFVAKLNSSGSALVYSTYLGGSGRDYGSGIAVDNTNSAYVTGLTSSSDFPTKNPLQANNAGGDPGCACDSFVSKISPTGGLSFSTYIGGSGIDYSSGIAVDKAGDVYVTGSTDSIDFPTVNPLQASNRGGYDAFVFKLNSTGSALIYSTYLGGRKNDYGNGIGVDSMNNAHIAGETLSSDFPKKSQLQNYNAGQSDAFVSMLNPEGSALVYSTFLGGSLADSAQSIAVDSTGNAYVAGSTQSINFRTSSPLQPAYRGGQDVFVAKISPTGMLPTVTITTLSSSPNPSIFGQEVTCTAVVTSSAGSPPDGEVITFVKGTSVLGTVPLRSGTASITVSTFSVGANSISAEYVGDPKFAFGVSKVGSQAVNKATTTTSVISSLNPSTLGQTVTFTASVTPQFTGTPSRLLKNYSRSTSESC